MGEPSSALRSLKSILRGELHRRRWTMENLERRTGLSHVTVSNALNEKSANIPSERTINLLADALKLDRAELLKIHQEALRLNKQSTRASPDANPSGSGGHGNRGGTSVDRDATVRSVARSGYREQVARIAPPRLVGRDAELEEIREFCILKESPEVYMYWRAPAWSGKSALLAWFVLHPPPGVRVVSFFVTARFASQNDRVAFADVVMEQLANLLLEPIPKYLSEATRDAHLFRMLAEAAEICQQRGERLVLVVDGLDEDRGATGPQGHSIAALLPARPPAGMRLVVSGRPNPPIPSDVPDEHPLRDPHVQRPLAVAGAAQVVRADMERELDRLLEGSPYEQDLLGLLTAALGGLSAEDLAELSGRTARQVIRHLGTVAGRSFTTRAGRWANVSSNVYILGHEELQDTAIEEFGDRRLEGYRQRLHAWADSYGQRGWPPETPEYLQHGYFRMLTATRDVPRIVACGTSRARHDRMRDITGGDTAALTEITAAQDALFDLPDPDLKDLGRLAVHRYSLVDNNSHIPPQLPAVLTMLGQPTRAEALARTNPKRIEALAGLLGALTSTGDYERAETLADSLTWDPTSLARADVVEALAKAGDYDRAESIAGKIAKPFEKAKALAGVARALAQTGQQQRASSVANLAEEATHSIPEPFEKIQEIIEVARVLARNGEHERASSLVEIARKIGGLGDPLLITWARVKIIGAIAHLGDYDRAENIARSISDDEDMRSRALGEVAEGVAQAGDYDRATAIARSVIYKDLCAQALGDVAMAAAHAGEFATAQATADTITHPAVRAQALVEIARMLIHNDQVAEASSLARLAEEVARSAPDYDVQARTLAAVARAAAQTGDHSTARALADLAEPIARQIGGTTSRARALFMVTTVLADIGEYDKAETIAHSIPYSEVTDDYPKEWALTAVAVALTQAGDYDRAEAIVRSITFPLVASRMLAKLAGALARAGEHKRAAALADEAEEHARSIPNRTLRMEALAEMAETLAQSGEYERAASLAGQAAITARSITHSGRPESLAQIAAAKALARTGGYSQAEAIARSIIEPFDIRVRALAAVAGALAQAGDQVRASLLVSIAGADVRSIIDPDERERFLHPVAAALARTGEYGQAEAMARTITWSSRRVRALIDVADQADPAVARKILVTLLRDDDWSESLTTLVRVDPGAVSAIAEEFTALLV
ncbi:Uncharacterized conserved protein HemY, contains two TPR repeats [Parafrankia irregularis]|uniref:Uncharacterized conserved protein HemY, contains two TPR repeats n=1 Tax=Parafrankia irregularis TaxID=795642 RepID=A0A0S4QJJ8_9ACTN|nr:MULTISPECIES: helix-turn-helix domain-containing protein [Parafrankia]MBE3204140.1 hypothetical protein [Parafrankia sp. CH37]CUU54984.1 Uncharacterized conserved protein HemY, contains two TPR repeats [Parafrankia irregularis]